MCKIADGIVLLLLGICSLSDWKKKTIPIYLLIILSATVAIFAILCHEVSTRLRVGGVLIGLLFLLVSRCTKEAIGYGDSWLILLLGVHLGSLRAIGILFAASMLAGITSLFYLWKYHWKRSATLPFVPFLSIAYMGAMFL